MTDTNSLLYLHQRIAEISDDGYADLYEKVTSPDFELGNYQGRAMYRLLNLVTRRREELRSAPDSTSQSKAVIPGAMFICNQEFLASLLQAELKSKASELCIAVLRKGYGYIKELELDEGLMLWQLLSAPEGLVKANDIQNLLKLTMQSALDPDASLEGYTNEVCTRLDSIVKDATLNTWGVFRKGIRGSLYYSLERGGES